MRIPHTEIWIIKIKRCKMRLTVPISVRFSIDESQALHELADLLCNGNVSDAMRLAVNAYSEQSPVLILVPDIRDLIFTMRRYCRLRRDDLKADSNEDAWLLISRIESAIAKLRDMDVEASKRG